MLVAARPSSARARRPSQNDFRVHLSPPQSAWAGAPARPLRGKAGLAARPPGPPPPVRRLRAGRSSPAAWTALMPCSNIPAACSRTLSRRDRPSAVTPPPSGYLIKPA